MRRRVGVGAGLLLLLAWACAPAPAAGGEADLPRAIGGDAPWATPVFETRAKREGPTVLVVGGIHGDEPAGAFAADQVRYWPLARGRLVIVPRANRTALAAGKRRTPGVPKELGDLNRNFPRAGRDEPARGDRAKALWTFVRDLAPDWVVDLHEGYDFHTVNPKSVGSSVIHSGGEGARVAAELVVRGINTLIEGSTWHWVAIRTAADGSLARAAAEHLRARTFIVETTTKGQARSRRVRQHRHAVHRLLRHLGMLGMDVSPDGVRAAAGDAILVGLYDSLGASGPGVPKLSTQLAAAPGIEVVRVGPEEVRTGGIFALDTLLFPGGLGSKQARNLDAAGRARVRAFIEGGGGYVGICAGAYLALDKYEWGLKVVNARTVSRKWARGRGRLPVELTPKGRAIFGDIDEPIPLLYHNGPVIEAGDNAALPGIEPLAYFRAEVAKNGTPKGIMKDSPAIFGGTFGKGRVIGFSPHPEQTIGHEKMVLDAVRWAARRGRATTAHERVTADGRDALADRSVFERSGGLQAKRETLDRWFRVDNAAGWRAIRSALIAMTDALAARHATRVRRWETILPDLSAPMPHTTAHAKALIATMNEQEGEAFDALRTLTIDTAWRLAQREPAAWRPLLRPAAAAEASPSLRMVGARLAGWLFGRPEFAGARAAVALALRRVMDPKRERDGRVRRAALDALAERPDGPSELIVGGLADPHWDNRVRASQIVAAFRMDEAVPVLIEALASARRRERAALGSALARLTGHAAEPDPVLWRAWLQAGRPDAGPGSAPEPSSRATFYGIDVESDRVLFLLDLSASMQAPVVVDEQPADGAPREGAQPVPTRVEVARAELAQALRMLPSDAHFGVIAFNTAVRAWQPALMPATPENRKEALAWLEELDAEGNTCLWGALRMALRQARRAPEDGAEPPIDTLVLLTDGKPTWYGVTKPGFQDAHQLRLWIRAWNPHGLIRIHTVAPKGAPGAGLMRNLARDHHGRFAVR